MPLVSEYTEFLFLNELNNFAIFFEKIHLQAGAA